MDSLGRVRPSVRPLPLSCLLYTSYTNWGIFFKLGCNGFLVYYRVPNICSISIMEYYIIILYLRII